MGNLNFDEFLDDLQLFAENATNAITMYLFLVSAHRASVDSGHSHLCLSLTGCDATMLCINIHSSSDSSRIITSSSYSPTASLHVGTVLDPRSHVAAYSCL